MDTEAIAGGSRELMRLAWPLIVSSSFSTVQITVDRVFASQLSSDAASAVTNGAMFFWTPFILPFCAAGYVSTFVAQYTGAGRPQKIGPVVWQAICSASALACCYCCKSPLLRRSSAGAIIPQPFNRWNANTFRLSAGWVCPRY